MIETFQESLEADMTVIWLLLTCFQRLYHIPEAHRIFVTGLEFMPDTSTARTVTGDFDFTLLSISADNQVKLHQQEKQGLVQSFSAESDDHFSLSKTKFLASLHLIMVAILKGVRLKFWPNVFSLFNDFLVQLVLGFSSVTYVSFYLCGRLNVLLFILCCFSAVQPTLGNPRMFYCGFSDILGGFCPRIITRPHSFRMFSLPQCITQKTCCFQQSLLKILSGFCNRHSVQSSSMNSMNWRKMCKFKLCWSMHCLPGNSSEISFRKK